MSGPNPMVSRDARVTIGLDITDEPALLRGSLEALLFVADQPVSTSEIAAVAGSSAQIVQSVLIELAGEYATDRRGFELREVAGGWRFYTSDRFAELVERFLLEGHQTRLTQAALETLAVVAYRQPVTRARVAAIRGVGVDGLFRSLLARGLIEECGSDGEGGGHLYRTTDLFLEKLGLRSLTDLPSLAPLLPDTASVDDVSSSG